MLSADPADRPLVRHVAFEGSGPPGARLVTKGTMRRAFTFPRGQGDPIGSGRSRRYDPRRARAADHDPPRRRAHRERAHLRRPLDRTRPLDRNRLAGRAALARRRLALHRAPALQGLLALRRPGPRRAVRRDGRRAERGDLPGDHRRLHPGTRPPARAGTRRDDRHGVRPVVRRRRLRAGGRSRGDRDGRRQPAGPRPRPRGRGGLRHAPARTAGDRQRGGHLPGFSAGAPLVARRCVCRLERRARRRRQPDPRAPRRPLRARAGEPSSGLAGQADATPAASAAWGQVPATAHRAVPRRARRAGDRARRRSALRRLDPRRDSRRLGVVPTVPGDPREARDGVQRLHVRLAVHGDGPDRNLRRHAGGQPPRVSRRDRCRARGRGGRQPPARRARPCEGEPRGASPALVGEHVEPDDEARAARS